MSKSVSLVIILLALVAFGSLASAQTKDTSCATPFSGGGSGIFQFNYCVSPNGNIVQMETPAGFQHLAPGHLSEGYGLCDVTAGIEYFDYGDGGVSSGNFWLAPVVLSTSPLVIGRKTNDGIWQLRQTFTTNAADSSIKIKMDVINQTALRRDATLVRYSDVNVNLNGLTDLFQATLLSAAASDLFGTPRSPGMQLRDAGHGTPTPHVQNVQPGPSPCNTFVHVKEPFFAGPGSLMLVYGEPTSSTGVISVPANGTKTATALYRPF
jgi:hypothetical protein